MSVLRGRIDDGYRDAGLDKATRALLIMDYVHHEVHEGSHYTAMWSVADIGAATTPADAMTLTFVTPDTTKWCHMVALFSGVGGALCTIREGGTGEASPTGTVLCNNNNRNSTNTSGILDLTGTAGKMSYDNELDTGGTLLRSEYISGASTNQNKGGSVSAERFEWVLKQNTRYQIAMRSTATVAASIVVHWYEHTSKS